VLPDAIAEFERYTTIAPYYSIGWANLGALYAQAGDYERAVEAMGHAVERAPAAASLPERLIEYQAALTAGHLEEQTIRLPISLDRDDEYLPDINHIQWLRLSILRQFLPQVRYGE
jgi:tetratricopeptide (TPR) repeat protein